MSILIETIKTFQQKVGTVTDGVWGNGSQACFVDRGCKLEYDWDKLREYFGTPGKGRNTLTQDKVDGFNAVLTAINENKEACNPVYAAYILATVWHETARTMKAIEEYGKGKGRKYGGKVDMNGRAYDLPHLYYGRGYVQLTWLSNYKRMSEILGIDFVNHPELTLVPKHAADIMIVGMTKGIFTGKSLSKCIRTGSYNDFVEARRIINGTDHAGVIATHAVKFLECLKIA